MVQTGQRFAVVDVDLAVQSAEPRRADARVAGDLVDAGRIVQARIALALVHVHVTGLAGVAGWALAVERVDAVDASSVVLARTAQALVDVDVAVIPGEPRSAEAVVAAVFVHADPVVAQRTTFYLALVYVFVAELTCQIRRT